MITLEKGRYFAAIYFAESPDCNILAAVFRNPGEEKFRFTYRFRYLKDDKAFDSADEKSWYTGTGFESEAATCDLFETIFRESLRFGFGEPTKLLPRTDDPQSIMQMIAHQPWANIQVEQDTKS